MIKFFWIVTLIMSVIGAFVTYTGISAANGAAHEAAAAAMGWLLQSSHTCFSRAITEMRSNG
ncbi:hypothetical protein [Pseudomonas rustica]